MTIILDENLPRGLQRILAAHEVISVQKAGYAGIENGDLLAKLEGIYDLFITADKNLRHQQNLAGRRLALVELPTNRWPVLRQMGPQIVQAVDRCQPGSYTVIPTA